MHEYSNTGGHCQINGSTGNYHPPNNSYSEGRGGDGRTPSYYEGCPACETNVGVHYHYIDNPNKDIHVKVGTLNKAINCGDDVYLDDFETFNYPIKTSHDLTPLIQAWREYKETVDKHNNECLENAKASKNSQESMNAWFRACKNYSFEDFMNWLEETQTKPIDST